MVAFFALTSARCVLRAAGCIILVAKANKSSAFRLSSRRVEYNSSIANRTKLFEVLHQTLICTRVGEISNEDGERSVVWPRCSTRRWRSAHLIVFVVFVVFVFVIKLGAFHVLIVCWIFGILHLNVRLIVRHIVVVRAILYGVAI